MLGEPFSLNGIFDHQVLARVARTLPPTTRQSRCGSRGTMVGWRQMRVFGLPGELWPSLTGDVKRSGVGGMASSILDRVGVDGAVGVGQGRYVRHCGQRSERRLPAGA